jgi:glycosyltransferase involved in cell wall biosynthesis
LDVLRPVVLSKFDEEKQNSDFSFKILKITSKYLLLLFLIDFAIFVANICINMKVTIITAVLNCVGYIADCIISVQSQGYKNLEHIIIDGGSVDGTLDVIEKHKDRTTFVLSEADFGMYDALNKGIAIAKGDILGILSADDRLAGNDVLSAIVDRIKIGDCDAVYGHLNFVSRDGRDIITRKWKSRPYFRSCLENGWMPPHPTLYVKKSALNSNTFYPLNYGTCGDYDFILNLLYSKQIRAVCIDKIMVYMREGGMSNGPLGNIFMSWVHDYRILADHQIPGPFRAVFLKKIRKLKQFRISVFG